MISENLKKLIAKLPLPYKAVAIKICFEKPDCEHFDGKKAAFCTYVNYVERSFTLQKRMMNATVNLLWE